MRVRIWPLGVALAAGLGCGGSPSDGEPFFPENYTDTYTEVRDCRANGGSHDFNYVRVVADPVALPAYRDRMDPFPVGAVVIKEEYESRDVTCSGPIMQWSAIQRLPDGNEDMLNWRWQRVDATRRVTGENLPRCFGCHAGCGPPDGYEGTCTVP